MEASVAVVGVDAAADRMADWAASVMAFRLRENRIDRASTAVASLELPPAVFKTCPWQPRVLIETGLRQWLRCCAPALRDRHVIGMPSHAIDEAWHGLILCTARYSVFWKHAYGRFLHHHPEGGAPTGMARATDSMVSKSQIGCHPTLETSVIHPMNMAYLN